MAEQRFFLRMESCKLLLRQNLLSKLFSDKCFDKSFEIKLSISFINAFPVNIFELICLLNIIVFGWQ